MLSMHAFIPMHWGLEVIWDVATVITQKMHCNYVASINLFNLHVSSLIDLRNATT